MTKILPKFAAELTWLCQPNDQTLDVSPSKLCKKHPRNTSDFGALSVRPFVKLSSLLIELSKLFHLLSPISTGGGGGVFHPMPSKWLRTPQRNKLAP